MSIPRRNKLWLNTKAELAIRNAMIEVEQLGANVELTNAVVLLDQAFNKVADFIDAENKQEDWGSIDKKAIGLPQY